MVEQVGDIGAEGWVRYDDPEVKAEKLNIELNNGRAAQMGILGLNDVKLMQAWLHDLIELGPR